VVVVNRSWFKRSFRYISLIPGFWRVAHGASDGVFSSFSSLGSCFGDYDRSLGRVHTLDIQLIQILLFLLILVFHHYDSLALSLGKSW
jgi:hypothetical protein